MGNVTVEQAMEQLRIAKELVESVTKEVEGLKGKSLLTRQEVAEYLHANCPILKDTKVITIKARLSEAERYGWLPFHKGTVTEDQLKEFIAKGANVYVTVGTLKAGHSKS